MVVPSNVPVSYGSSTTVPNPLTWLVGLTAGYFSNLNIVQVLNMILFPPVPASYTPPTLTLSINDSSLRAVGLTFTPVLTLTYTKNDSGTASGYTFDRTVPSPAITPLYSTISTSNSATTSQNLYTTQPTSFTWTGTNSHISGDQKFDTYGNPTPIPASVQANNNMVSSPSSVSVQTIWPYFYGKVNQTFTNITPAQIVAGTEVLAQSSGNISVNFGTLATEKGFLAIPQSQGSQTTATYLSWIDSVNTNNKENIPGTLFNGSPFLVSNVPYNGLFHTYSVYFFTYSTATQGPWTIQITSLPS